MYFNTFAYYLQCPLAAVAQIQHISLVTVQKEEGKRLLVHYLRWIILGSAFHTTNAFHDFLNST